MVAMGYCRDDITDSLCKMKYDDIAATYLLLGRSVAEVGARRRGPADPWRPALTWLCCLCPGGG